MLLAIDTSTSLIGAAVHDGERVRARVTHLESRRHAELLAPAVEQVLAEAGIDRSGVHAVVCGVGPGPFTGLRVGVVTALVLAHALGLPPARGVCSLDALAHQVVGRHVGELLVATDARRREVYWARYEVGPTGTRRLDGPQVNRPADLPTEVRGWPTVGRGPLLHPEQLPHPLPGGPLDVDPGAVAELAVRAMVGAGPGGEAHGLLPAEPLYLRRPDAAPAPPVPGA